MTIDKPHNSRFRITGNPATKSGVISFFDGEWLGFADKSRRCPNLFNFSFFLWYTVKDKKKS